MDKTDGYDWVFVKEAWRMLPAGIRISLSGFRLWVNENKYGIVTGEFGGRTVVRVDTIPKVIE